jgi:hypothetical protein
MRASAPAAARHGHPTDKAIPLVIIGPQRAVLEYPDTKPSRRTWLGRAPGGPPALVGIPLDAGTVAVLRAYRKAQQEDRFMWGAAWQDTGLVFTKEDGSPLSPNGVSQRVDRLVERNDCRRARRGRRRTGQGRACSRRLLLGHSPKVRARCSPAGSTNRLEGSH